MSQQTEALSADRYVFLIEGLDVGDALLRVLGLVSVQQAQVRALSFSAPTAASTRGWRWRG